MTANRNRRPIIPQIIGIVMLLWALNPQNPYGYYMILRIAICVICGYLAFLSLNLQRSFWVWVLGAVAVLYNPVIPIHLTRDIWSVLNVATIILLAITFGILRGTRSSNKNGEDANGH